MAAAVISALAVLIGALVGGAISYFGARQQARNQAEGQREAWQRDRRAEAYEALLAARTGLLSFEFDPAPSSRVQAINTGAIITQLTVAEDEARRWAHEYQHAQEVQYRRLTDALAVAAAQVEVFGSATVRQATRAWLEAWREGRGKETEKERKLYDALLTAIRSELGNDSMN